MSRFWKLDLISEYMFFISNSIFGLKFSCLGSTPILASKSLIYGCLFLLWDFAIPESVALHVFIFGAPVLCLFSLSVPRVRFNDVVFVTSGNFPQYCIRN